MRKRILSLALLAALLAAGLVSFKLRYGGPTRPFPAKGTEPLLPSSVVEVVAELPEAPGNLAVSEGGRVFVALHPEGRPSRSLVEIVDGRPVDWPRAGEPLTDGVFSVRIDRQGRLWALSPGFHGLKGARLVAFDLETRDVVHRWDLPRSVAGWGSYVQDFQVSPDGTRVFLADVSGFAKHPALVVYDVERREGRRVLERDRSVTDEPFLIRAKGRDMLLLGGLFAMHPAVDTLALDAAGEWLYFGPMSHETLFRAPTADLANSALSPSALSARVEAFAGKPQTDGASTDVAGNVYLTEVESASIAMVRPDRSLVTLVRDPRWRWPDGLSFGPEDWLYLTDSAIPDLMLRSKAHVRASAPFHVYRLRTGVPGTPGR
jgi:hypothetical protein